MEEPAEPKQEKRQNAFAALLSGNLLSQEAVVKHLPYMLFLSLVALVYIANGFWAESSVRYIHRMENEIKELRSEQISIKSELNNTIIESELKKIIDQRQMGLIESIDPPKKLVVKSSDIEDIN